MDAQEYRNLAEEEYLKAVGIIYTMARISGHTFARGKSYATILDEFEAAIQGILLYAIVNDGEMYQPTKDFLKNICVTGNILKHINSIGKRKYYSKWVNVTWDNIDNLNRPVDQIQEIIRESISTSVLTFVEPLAKADRDVSTRSFIDDIAKSVETMMTALLKFDKAEDQDLERDVSADLQVGMEVFNNIFKSHWLHYKNKEVLNKGVHNIYLR